MNIIFHLWRTDGNMSHSLCRISFDFESLTPFDNMNELACLRKDMDWWNWPWFEDIWDIVCYYWSPSSSSSIAVKDVSQAFSLSYYLNQQQTLVYFLHTTNIFSLLVHFDYSSRPKLYFRWCHSEHFSLFWKRCFPPSFYLFSHFSFLSLLFS